MVNLFLGQHFVTFSQASRHDESEFWKAEGP